MQKHFATAFKIAICLAGVAPILLLFFYIIPASKTDQLESKLFKSGAYQIVEFQMVEDRYPSSLEELVSFEPQGKWISEKPPLLDEFAKRVRSGDIELIENLETSTAENTFIAYDSSCPDSGGRVVYASGSVDWIAAKQFRIMLKMQKESE